MSDRNKFQEMLQLAEFGVRRMEERRAFEFKIFISYSTLLVLALYQLIKQQNPISVSLESPEGIVLYVLALFMHIIYVMWQIGVGIAMKNDAHRRNFYLKRAESVSNEPLNYSVSEKKIVITEKYREQFLYLDLIWGDWNRMFVVAIPTILFSIIVYLFIRKCCGSIDIYCRILLAGVIPLIPILVGLILGWWKNRKDAKET